jgi:ribulose-phosphate 3-epimerase
LVQVDGGVNEKIAEQLVKAGADILNSGSYVNKAKNPKMALKKLEEIFKKTKGS